MGDKMSGYVLVLWLTFLNNNKANSDGNIYSIDFHQKNQCEKALIVIREKSANISGVCIDRRRIIGGKNE